MAAGGGRQPGAIRQMARGGLTALLAVVAVTVLPSIALARTGHRVTVGLFGDSVTEGVVIPNFEHEALAAQLTTAETRYGFRPGGEGLIAANQYQWHFNAYGIFGFQRIPIGGWAIVGSQDDGFVESGTDGVSGYSARTLSPTATATTTVTAPDIEVMYATSLTPCAFKVTAGSRSWTISTYAPGIQIVAGETPINVGSGSHTITVHGPNCGALIFDGVVAQAPVAAHTTQVQFDNDGHAARLPQTDLLSRVEEGILEQHYKVSVFLYGYIGELVVSPGPSAVAYEQALLTRVRLARMNGGACLIVHPTPLAGVPERQTRLVTQIERSVARRAGCTYTTALANLWNPETAIHRGLVVIDGIHPTAAGYKLIAQALAPVIATLSR